MNHERSHLNVRLEVQLNTVEQSPDDVEAADELERIRAQLLALDLETDRVQPVVGPECRLTCLECGTKGRSQDMIADAGGEPFKAYYCNLGCFRAAARRAEREKNA